MFAYFGGYFAMFARPSEYQTIEVHTSLSSKEVFRRTNASTKLRGDPKTEKACRQAEPG